MRRALAVATLAALPALAACERRGASAPPGDSARADAAAATPASEGSAWRPLPLGGRSGAFALAEDGTLRWDDRALAPPLPTRTTDGTAAPVAYAVSPASPSGRWALAQGEGPTFASLYVLDRETRTTRETPATKYGIAPWVAWAPALPYAVVSNRVEGTALLYRVDLASGAADQIDFSRAVRPPLGATPAESTLRWLDAEGGAFEVDARVACNDAVERCDGAPAATTRRFRVDLRALRVEALPGGA